METIDLAGDDPTNINILIDTKSKETSSIYEGGVTSLCEELHFNINNYYCGDRLI